MLKNEVWLVMQKRNDELMPDPVKCMYADGEQALHFSEEDAVIAANAVNAELGGNFAGVFRCLLEVVEARASNAVVPE